MAALTAAPALGLVAGCGGPSRGDLTDVREAVLHLTLDEKVSWRGQTPSKRLRLGLRGGTVDDGRGGSELALTIESAELVYHAADGAEQRLATSGTAPDPGRDDALARVRRGLIEALVGQTVRIGVGGAVGDDAGLRYVVGCGDALETASARLAASEVAAATVVDEAVLGLRPLVDDAAVLRRLRGAGFGRAPDGIGGQDTEVRRQVAVHVDGQGLLDVPCFGRPGFDDEGSPTVRCEGRPDDAPQFHGEPGGEPPPAVGPVRVDEIRVVAETQYTGSPLRPLQGSLTVELPHVGGPVVVRALEFRLVVLR